MLLVPWLLLPALPLLLLLPQLLLLLLRSSCRNLVCSSTLSSTSCMVAVANVLQHWPLWCWAAGALPLAHIILTSSSTAGISG